MKRKLLTENEMKGISKDVCEECHGKSNCETNFQEHTGKPILRLCYYCNELRKTLKCDTAFSGLRRKSKDD